MPDTVNKIEGVTYGINSRNEEADITVSEKGTHEKDNLIKKDGKMRE